MAECLLAIQFDNVAIKAANKVSHFASLLSKAAFITKLLWCHFFRWDSLKVSSKKLKDAKEQKICYETKLDWIVFYKHFFTTALESLMAVIVLGHDSIFDSEKKQKRKLLTDWNIFSLWRKTAAAVGGTRIWQTKWNKDPILSDLVGRNSCQSEW